MRSKFLRIAIACGAAAIMLGGCPLFNRDDDDMMAKVSLNDFVREQIANTSDTSEPVSIDDLDFKADATDDFADILDS